MKVGEIVCMEGEILLNENKRIEYIRVKNTGDHPVHVTSHFHFFEANRNLKFERAKALGMRLDIPAGAAIRFVPGEEKDVRLVEFGGKKEIWGFNNLVNGQVTEQKEKAIIRAREKGFIKGE